MSKGNHLLHLAARFLGSLDPRPPAAADHEWVRRHLTAPELAIWDAMSNADQRHSIEVAREVEAVVEAHDRRDVGDGWPSPGEQGFESIDHRRSVMIAAALLHDSGKNVSRLGTPARVGATVLRPLVSPTVVDRWSNVAGMRGRLVDYWRHPRIGARALETAGSHPLVSTWAAEHHQPATSWTVDETLGRILRDCDND